jgi:hypothetical protein
MLAFKASGTNADMFMAVPSALRSLLASRKTRRCQAAAIKSFEIISQVIASSKSLNAPTFLLLSAG